MAVAYIGLGSNLGKRRENLLQAWRRLGENEAVSLLALSGPYRTEPVGMDSANWFINAVGSIRTTLEPEELLQKLFAIEAGLGRKRERASAPQDRPLDLDLLYWDDRVSDDPRVTLPHPEIARRLFVLVPLAEIGPEVRHPVLQKTSLEMLAKCRAGFPWASPESQVRKMSWTKKTGEVLP
jgi:2-amino-4-hydroxy-6-hydroxymethyldihydropteridine diphosphokinase